MHEIKNHDNLFLTGEPAWHGLGTVVEDAPTPTAALVAAELDWTVRQAPLTASTAQEGDFSVPQSMGVLNYRDDTLDPLGIVGSGYKPVQNRELADFAEALAEDGDVVKVETAGSIRNGKRVWFLLRGESFSVRDKGSEDDVLHPYILLSNGHDGTAAMRCTPTTVRVVCSNTLHMVIPRGASNAGGVSSRFNAAGMAIRHNGNIWKKLAQAKAALGLYHRSLETTRDLSRTLAAKDVTRSQIQDFWLDVYQRIQAPVPVSPSTPGEKAQANRAEEAMKSMSERFDAERHVGGATAWNAINAFTGWAQHDRRVTGDSERAREEQRLKNRLMGNTAKETHAALEMGVKAFT